MNRIHVRLKPGRMTVLVAAVATVAAALGFRFLGRDAPAETLAVSYGEVELRIAGPGTVQARVPVTVAARISAQVLSVHADHGERVKRGQLLALLDDRDFGAKQAAAIAGRDASGRNGLLLASYMTVR